jgi:hypothetical protein
VGRRRSHSSLASVDRRRPQICSSLHLLDKFLLVIISTDAYSDEAKSPLQLHLDNLKPTSGLNSPLSTDVNPIDVVERNHPFFESVLEDKLILHDDQPSVTNPIGNQRNERDENEKYDDIENGVAKDESEPVFNEISSDPGIQDQRDKVDQRLLVVEIEFIFEDLPVLFHT